MSLRWSDSAIPGVRVGEAFVAEDSRGTFVKHWAQGAKPHSLNLDEVFYSTSRRGTVRGMHVQMGHAAGHRLVFVTQGAARDFVIDLRLGSPTYGTVVETRLEPGLGSLLVPPGCAHGFESLCDDTTMLYIQEGGYEPDLDIGVHWTSCGFEPSSANPIVSDRDNALPHISHFNSPFLWKISE